MQDRVGEGTGNCFEACIASLLECPLHAVPDFPRDNGDFIEAVQRWLSSTENMFYCRVPVDEDSDAAAAFVTGDVWHVIEGVSERGGQHACVGLNGRLVHDPHPGGHGLVKVESFGFLASRMKEGSHAG